jgi:serine/threonine protein kinase
LEKYREIYNHLNEPNILKEFVNLNFLPNIISSFQDYDNLYLVTNYFSGKTLYDYKDEIFSEEQIKFISACVIESLSYLREKKVIHRDVRMQNLILDENNYINLIDFSYSIIYSEKEDFKNFVLGNDFDNAPEIQNQSKYDYNSDYYRIGGTIIYYLIFKKFYNNEKKKFKKNEFFINYLDNSRYSFSCIDFINKLIINDYKKRIGFQSINELKNHSFFQNFNWNDLKEKKINSPLNFRSKYFKKSKCLELKNNNTKFKMIFNNTLYKNLLDKYNYINEIIIKEIYKNIKINQ